MTTRNVTKQLACLQDLQLGRDRVTQTRGGSAYTLDSLDIPIVVSSVAALNALDVEVYTRARVYTTDTEAKDFVYSGTSTDGEASSGPGTWLDETPVRPSETQPVTHNTRADAIADNNINRDYLYILDSGLKYRKISGTPEDGGFTDSEGNNFNLDYKQELYDQSASVNNYHYARESRVNDFSHFRPSRIYTSAEVVFVRPQDSSIRHINASSGQTVTFDMRYADVGVPYRFFCRNHPDSRVVIYAGKNHIGVENSIDDVAGNAIQLFPSESVTLIKRSLNPDGGSIIIVTEFGFAPRNTSGTLFDMQERGDGLFDGNEWTTVSANSNRIITLPSSLIMTDKTAIISESSGTNQTAVTPVTLSYGTERQPTDGATTYEINNPNAFTVGVRIIYQGLRA